MGNFTAGELRSFEAMMRDVPGYDRYDSGCDGIFPECRSCRFHRPFWKHQSCVFEKCPYCISGGSTLRKKSETKEM